VVGLDAYPMYSLSKLGTTETFISHAKNALVKSTVLASLNQISVELAPMSVNTILLRALRVGVNPDLKKNSLKASVYPNPANDLVQLDFSLPEKSRLKIDLFDAKGQLVKTMINSIFEAGNQQKEISLNRISNGVYWLRITSESATKTIKLIKN
jgi:hypothetical protein